MLARVPRGVSSSALDPTGPPLPFFVALPGPGLGLAAIPPPSSTGVGERQDLLSHLGLSLFVCPLNAMTSLPPLSPPAPFSSANAGADASASETLTLHSPTGLHARRKSWVSHDVLPSPCTPLGSDLEAAEGRGHVLGGTYANS